MLKEGSSDYKKVRKRWFFNEPLTECFFVKPKMVLLWHRCEEPFKHLLFLRAYVLRVTPFDLNKTCLFIKVQKVI